ncbi:hypothetical protein FKW77_001287 [Venturia effusa]|uniref:Uncharacterized protein n=1 Tax=Venturia effusa TaxID=50376 RepID=A0A517LME3_9PEZI|nr:hypothetical protein FKW77_001287 [Venturia effusa]
MPSPPHDNRSLTPTAKTGLAITLLAALALLLLLLYLLHTTFPHHSPLTHYRARTALKRQRRDQEALEQKRREAQEMGLRGARDTRPRSYGNYGRFVGGEGGERHVLDNVGRGYAGGGFEDVDLGGGGNGRGDAGRRGVGEGGVWEEDRRRGGQVGEGKGNEMGKLRPLDGNKERNRRSTYDSFKGNEEVRRGREWERERERKGEREMSVNKYLSGGFGHEHGSPGKAV